MDAQAAKDADVERLEAKRKREAEEGVEAEVAKGGAPSGPKLELVEVQALISNCVRASHGAIKPGDFDSRCIFLSAFVSTK